MRTLLNLDLKESEREELNNTIKSQRRGPAIRLNIHENMPTV